MKKFILVAGFSICILLMSNPSRAQSEWPKVITTPDGTIINVYQPQPQSFAGATLKSQSAISILEPGSKEPIFGVFWSVARVATDRDTREVAIEFLKVTDLKIPADSSRATIESLKVILETYIPKVESDIPMDELLASLDEDIDEAKLAGDISNRLPKVIYTNQQSMLVLIDGVPRMKKNSDWGLNVVINTPFTIIQNKDGKFYLYGGSHWYSAGSTTGPYVYSNDKVPKKLKKIAKFLQKSARKNNDLADGVIPDKLVYNIIISTTPEELIQSNGNPNLIPIEGTSLLYVKNSDNDIFVDTQTQLYYVLLSGRWYMSKELNDNSQWNYVASNKLPPDFAKIPEGSPKDNVLVSVAGTAAAREAVMDAQIPQTAKIDRKRASTNVRYEGKPQFKAISGTNLQYAINTSSTVLLYHDKFYALDNGVWFISDNPGGPWVVSVERPGSLDDIPPSSPVYNAKYVQIYDSTPDDVYMGYTPGYLNNYVDGPTVVYGTGYTYDSWMGDDYFPEAWTWGFDMDYNPWCGWGFGMGYGFEWFNTDYGYGWGGQWYGGWWGPSAYRPAYGRWDRGRSGLYGRNALINGENHMNMRYANNIYRNRSGVIPRNNVGSGGNLNNRGPAGGNSIFTDRQGNIYQRGSLGQWQQRTNRTWVPAQANARESLNRQQQMRERGQVRAQNFQRASSFSAMRSGGGGGFRGGGGSFRR
jgi:hypothetical protein